VSRKYWQGKYSAPAVLRCVRFVLGGVPYWAQLVFDKRRAMTAVRNKEQEDRDGYAS